MADLKPEKKKQVISCDYCNNNVYDEEDQCYYCEMDVDEDDMVRLMTNNYKDCPYFVPGDEYLVVRHQM